MGTSQHVSKYIEKKKEESRRNVDGRMKCAHQIYGERSKLIKLKCKVPRRRFQNGKRNNGKSRTSNLNTQ